MINPIKYECIHNTPVNTVAGIFLIVPTEIIEVVMTVDSTIHAKYRGLPIEFDLEYLERFQRMYVPMKMWN